MCKVESFMVLRLKLLTFCALIVNLGKLLTNLICPLLFSANYMKRPYICVSWFFCAIFSFSLPVPRPLTLRLPWPRWRHCRSRRGSPYRWTFCWGGCSTFFAVPFYQGDERKAVDVRANHGDHDQVILFDSGSGGLLRHPQAKRKGHGGFQTTLFTHGAFKVQPATPILKLEPDRHGAEGPLRHRLIAVIVRDSERFCFEKTDPRIRL